MPSRHLTSMLVDSRAPGHVARSGASRLSQPLRFACACVTASVWCACYNVLCVWHVRNAAARCTLQAASCNANCSDCSRAGSSPAGKGAGPAARLQARVAAPAERWEGDRFTMRVSTLEGYVVGGARCSSQRKGLQFEIVKLPADKPVTADTSSSPVGAARRRSKRQQPRQVRQDAAEESRGC